MPYFQADQYTVPEETTCIEIRVPAHPSFLPQLAGLVAIATKAINYEGSDFAHIMAIKTIWMRAYNETDWGQCMNCEELTECITPLLDNLKAEIIQQITYNQYGTTNPTGLPLPEYELTRNQAGGSNPTCDLDILWAQCTQIIGYGNQLVLDALELAESATNDVELVQVLTSLPVIDELGGDAIAGYIEFLQQGISDNYAAQVTAAYLEQAACALFCLCKGDCEITLERIVLVFKNRVEMHFDTPVGTLGTISDLFAYFVDLDIDSTIIADALLFVVFEGGVLTNQFLGDVGTKALETLLELAVNDANDDWLLLCPDCPIYAENVGIIGRCGEGVIDTIEFEDAVAFDVVAYEDPVSSGSWMLALKLPAGDWTVTLNSITGTIVPPVDLTQTAYAWFDPTVGFTNVLWNAPAEPDDFGSHDTTTGIFSIWCDTQDWNVALFNQGSFTANFTVTAL